MKIKCEFCKIWLPLILIIIAGFYIAWQFVPPASSNNLRIATGSKTGAYYQYAQEYQQALKAEGVNLEIQTTAGSVEAMQLLRDGEVDLAFIQGGIGKNVPEEEGLHSIASLFYEPLWVFMRKGEVSKSTCYLHELQGKRLAIGAEGSGTRALASRLLCDNGIKRDNTELFSISNEEAISKLEAGEVDAAFFVASPKSDTVAKLTSHADITVMNFQRHADAYTRHYPFLDTLELGEGSLNLQSNVPDKEKTLLAATAALVVGPDLHSDHVRLLTREALRIHSKPGLLEKPWQFPSRHHLEIPIHPDAEQYLENGPSFLEKYLPFPVVARVDQLKIMLIPLLTLLLPLAKGVMPLYKWRIRSRTYRWYKDLNQVDRDLEDYDLPQTQQAIGNMQTLHGALAQEVSVPLSYMSEFYSLRMHTDHILSRLRAKEIILKGGSIETTVDEPAIETTTDLSVQTATENNVPDSIESKPEPDTEAGHQLQATNKTQAATESIKNMASKIHLPRNFSLSKPKPSQDEMASPEADGGTTSKSFKSMAAKMHLPHNFKMPTLMQSAAEKEAQEEAARIAKAKEEEARLAALASQHKQANKLVQKHVATGMALSAVPIPVIDVAALTSTQLNLMHSLSEHYGVEFDRERGKSILLSVISGSLPTTTLMSLSSLSKSIPGIGTLIGGASLSATSGAIIYATGKVFMRHFEKGGTLENFDSQQQKQAFQTALKEGLAKNDPT